MAKSRTLKRALSILLALCLVMSLFAVNVFAETTTNPDGTTTETTVTTNTQDDTPSAGYTTTTATTTAYTTGRITETGATVIGTETRTDMQVTKPSDFVRYGEHTVEGDDDMPAHAKSTLSGVSLTIPITNGRLNMGTWQGIYFCEYRDYGGARKLVVTIIGE